MNTETPRLRLCVRGHGHEIRCSQCAGTVPSSAPRVLDVVHAARCGSCVMNWGATLSDPFEQRRARMIGQLVDHELASEQGRKQGNGGGE